LLSTKVGAKFKLVFCAKYDIGLDLGFWEILKPLKWTNITSFFLIKTNGRKDSPTFLFLCEFKSDTLLYLLYIYQDRKNIKVFLQWLLSTKGYQFSISRFSNAN
jgi:hypothetical protein